jgi:hypothetical protein
MLKLRGQATQNHLNIGSVYQRETLWKEGLQIKSTDQKVKPANVELEVNILEYGYLMAVLKTLSE